MEVVEKEAKEEALTPEEYEEQYKAEMENETIAMYYESDNFDMEEIPNTVPSLESNPLFSYSSSTMKTQESIAEYAMYGSGVDSDWEVTNKQLT